MNPMSSREGNASVTSPSGEDLAAITAVARGYIEGWLDGDAERMRRCLHPDLVKRTVRRDAATGVWRLGRPADDVFRRIASVRVLSQPYMDYLQMAKLGDRWLIANVLWELRQGEMG
jgi:hypothetical protein